MTKKKIIVAAAVVLLITFAVWNVLWILHYNQYKVFRDKTNMEIICGEVFYTKNSNGYHFNVFMPSYLRFNGNLAANKSLPDHEMDDIVMIVWLNLFHEDTYGVMVNDSDGIQYQIYMDSQGNPVFEDEEDWNYIDEINPIIEANRELIDETYEAWDTVFGIRD